MGRTMPQLPLLDPLVSHWGVPVDSACSSHLIHGAARAPALLQDEHGAVVLANRGDDLVGLFELPVESC